MGIVFRRSCRIHSRHTCSSLLIPDFEADRVLDVRQQHAVHPVGGVADYSHAYLGVQQRVLWRADLPLLCRGVLVIAIVDGVDNASVRRKELGPFHHHDYDLWM